MDNWETWSIETLKILGACSHRSQVSTGIRLVPLKLNPSQQMNFRNCLQPRSTDLALSLLMRFRRHSH